MGPCTLGRGPGSGRRFGPHSLGGRCMPLGHKVAHRECGRRCGTIHSALLLDSCALDAAAAQGRRRGGPPEHQVLVSALGRHGGCGSPPWAHLRVASHAGLNDQASNLLVGLSGVVAAEVCHEVVEGDVAVTVGHEPCLFHETLGLGSVEALAEHLLQVVKRDDAGVVLAETPKGTEDESLVYLDARAHHSSQELRVVNLLVAVGIEGLEDPSGLVILNAEALLEDLPELMKLDRAAFAQIQLDEGLSNLGTLLVGKRPGHHLHAGTPEARGVRKLAQRVHYCLVEGRLALHALPLHDPGVFHGLDGREALRGLALQKMRDKVVGTLGDPSPLGFVYPHVAIQDVQHCLLGVVVNPEGQMAYEENEDYDPETPEVAHVGVALEEHLRGHVREGAELGLHLVGARVPDLAEPEVDQLKVVAVLRVIQEVLEFQVAMHDADGVQVVDCQQHLVGCISCVSLGEPALLADAFPELAAI
mmetsp:Transcript_8601/g.19595  ORF Transcript_8601/g.19595 Transcript_8601/m.19595 type:complete len:475 (-) Transcript_8601:231-1655(-)